MFRTWNLDITWRLSCRITCDSFSLATVCIQGIQLGASANIMKINSGSSEQEIETLQPVDNVLSRCLSFGK